MDWLIHTPLATDATTLTELQFHVQAVRSVKLTQLYFSIIHMLMLDMLPQLLDTLEQHIQHKHMDDGEVQLGQLHASYGLHMELELRKRCGIRSQGSMDELIHIRIHSRTMDRIQQGQMLPRQRVRQKLSC